MNTSEKPLVDQEYLLQKFPGKGGWTFAAIPEIRKDKHAWFGWVKVRGSIDGYEISDYHLMPVGDGTLILPVKGAIRKVIGKNEGDYVHIILYSQQLPTVVPEDFMICLQDDKTAFEKFHKLSEPERKELIDWIYSAPRDETKVERIAKALDILVSKTI